MMFLLLLLPAFVHLSAIHRPDPEYGFDDTENSFDDTKYAFDLLAKEPEVVEEGGVLRWATAGNWPVLSGGKTPDRGMAATLATVEGCTVGVPHHHIRSDQLAYVTKGCNGTFGILKEDGTLVENKMDAGHLLYVPQGIVHYYVNYGCTEGEVLFFYNHENPGTVLTIPTAFSVSNPVLETLFGDKASMMSYGAMEFGQLMPHLEECMQRCANIGRQQRCVVQGNGALHCW